MPQDGVSFRSPFLHWIFIIIFIESRMGFMGFDTILEKRRVSYYDQLA